VDSKYAFQVDDLKLNTALGADDAFAFGGLRLQLDRLMTIAAGHVDHFRPPL
jgi:hypothetical protein